jgi:uncharacterized protein (UPF0335 family)
MILRMQHHQPAPQHRLASPPAIGQEQGQRVSPEHKGRPMSDITQDAYNVTADELRQFIERYEHLEAEKKDITDQQKEVMAEAKGRGYDTKVLRKIIAIRKRKPDEIAEEEAVMELYKAALGME